MPTDPATALLLEAARRASRGGVRRLVLKLHLSHIAQPRPHHARIARAILLDAAQRLDGEVLRLPDGDLALLCLDQDAASRDWAGPDSLPAVLTRLFAATLPREAALFTLWRLPAESAIMAQALAAQPRPAAPGIPPPAPAPANPLESVAALLDFAATPELLRRQTAIRLRPQNSVQPFAASFRELTFSIDALEARSTTPGQARADPFVFRHLASRLDDRMLASLYRRLQDGSTPEARGPAAGAGLPLHINLALPGILSPPFERLAALARGRGVALGVELSFAEAAAEPGGFAAARARLQQAGAALILDGISAEAAMMTRPGTLGADLLKLDWAPSLSRLGTEDSARLREAIDSIGAARIVLHHAESEAALAWGLAQGITQFQGRHVDAMLAARRASACHHAQACSLRQCIDRAAAIAGAARADCKAPALLEDAPPRAAVAA